MAGDFTDLVVVIPGILGSRLARRVGGKLEPVWDLSIRTLPRALKRLAAGDLAVAGNGANPPNDGVEAVDLLNYQLLPGFFGVDDYDSLLAALRGAVGTRQVLKFPYDWRLSNRHASARLNTMVRDELKTWNAERGRDDAKVWLIGHSMGGLVARHFCEHHGGAEITRGVVTIGTPHRGAPKALAALVNGHHIGPLDLSKLVRSLPSVYELLPLFPVLHGEQTYRIAEAFRLDPVTGDDVPGPSSGAARPAPFLDKDMLRRALRFHAEIRMPAESRATRGKPTPYQLKAFFNRRQSTPASARLDGGRVTLLDIYPTDVDGRRAETDMRGDGTVPSFASVPIEWSKTDAALPVAEKHAAMQAAQVLHDSLINWMRPLDVAELKGAEQTDASVIALTVPSILERGAPLDVVLGALRPTRGQVEVTRCDEGAPMTKRVGFRVEAQRDEVVQFEAPAPGVYRVVARAEDRAMPPVSDYVYVVDPAVG